MFKTKVNFFAILITFNFGISQIKASKTAIWEPVPKKVDAYSFSKAPSDATILFDGKSFSKWVGQYSNKVPKWKINEDGSPLTYNQRANLLLGELRNLKKLLSVALCFLFVQF